VRFILHAHGFLFLALALHARATSSQRFVFLSVFSALALEYVRHFFSRFAFFFCLPLHARATSSQQLVFLSVFLSLELEYVCHFSRFAWCWSTRVFFPALALVCLAVDFFAPASNDSFLMAFLYPGANCWKKTLWVLFPPSILFLEVENDN
jgi:hypothetical protein